MRKYSKLRKGMTAVLLAAAVVVGTIVPAATSYAASSKSDVVNTEGGIQSVFPQSYWAALTALQKKHPNWHFQAFYTGVTWSSCFGVSEAEMYPTRNLLQYNPKNESQYYPTSWYSTDEYVGVKNSWGGTTYYPLSQVTYKDGKWYLNNGTELKDTTVWSPFNWAKNEWNVFDSGGWTQASEEAVAYCMDPRNFLNEEQIFQFEDIALSGNSVSLSEVEQVFKAVNDGVNPAGTNYWTLNKVKNDQGKEVSYAQAVYNIGYAIGVNPVALASRIVQEQGVGASPLISGKAYSFNGKNIPEGYYNYFNMGASGNSREEIIYNGLKEAQDAGWNDRYKALLGGAVKFKSSYVDCGQSTIYLQKFNVDSSSKYLFWGQYMQSLQTPQYEAKKLYNTYAQNGSLDVPRYFLIPVFDSMPGSPAVKPTQDGNPNYKLGSIFMNGSLISGFNTDVTEYNLTVNKDTAYVRLDISPYAKGTTKVKLLSNLSGQCTEVTGDLSNYQLNVLPGDNEIKIACTAENGDGRMYILRIHRDGSVNYGDVNADGKYDLVDIVIMRRHIQGLTTLTGTQAEAADINGDGRIDLVDIVYIRGYLMGKRSEIPQR